MKQQSPEIASRVPCRFRLLLATEPVLGSLDVKDVAGILDRDAVAVANPVEAIAGTDHGFLDTHAGSNRMK